MRSIRVFFSILCVFAAALVGACCAAETAKQNSEKSAAVILPPATEVSAPFNLDAPPSERVNSIEFRSQDAMAAQDLQAASDVSALIEQKAAMAGFDLHRGNWSYRQMVCPALPEHILLLYSRSNGLNDSSMFSAVVPRSGRGTVLIVPILRRGYALYSPAPVNPITIAAFNHIRAGERAAPKMDWLTTGLCYAALSGVHVVLPLQAQSDGKDAFPVAIAPLLQIGEDGITVVRFVDVEAPLRPKEWNLTFDKNGKLLKIAISPVAALTAKPVP